MSQIGIFHRLSFARAIAMTLADYLLTFHRAVRRAWTTALSATNLRPLQVRCARLHAVPPSTSPPHRTRKRSSSQAASLPESRCIRALCARALLEDGALVPRSTAVRPGFEGAVAFAFRTSDCTSFLRRLEGRGSLPDPICRQPLRLSLQIVFLALPALPRSATLLTL